MSRKAAGGISSGLLPAYPYFGSKRRIARELWEAFGLDVPNYVEPFAGSCAVLLAREPPGKIETVNDAHAAIPNFLRAVRAAPDEVAEHAAWPVSEIDMHARHADLVARMGEDFRERLRADPRYFDSEIAGWWVWGASIWIGSGWCDAGHRNSGCSQRPQLGGGKRAESWRKRPAIGGRGARPGGESQGGVGIFRDLSRLPHLIGPNNGAKRRQLPSLSGCDGSGVGYGRGIFARGRREDLARYFARLAERLARVRIVCGDWSRVVTPAVTLSHGVTAVLLDPPYGEGADRTARLYAVDSTDVAAAARDWAIEAGRDPRFRIALCGHEAEHERLVPSSWRRLAWKGGGGYGNQDNSGEDSNENARAERVWFSPGCLGKSESGPLFDRERG